MLTPIAITLILNSLTLTVALGLLILILWHDTRRLTNLHFTWFLLMVILWSSGSLLGRASAIAGADPALIADGLRMLEIGFTNSALALYLYATVLSGNRSRQFQLFGIMAVIVLMSYQVIFIAIGTRPDFTIESPGILRYSFSPSSILSFAIIDFITLGMVWQGFRRIQRPALAFGIMLFCFGQLAALLSPRLQALAIAEDAGAIATLVMAFSLVQAQIIHPLAGQTRQIAVVRDVGLAITSRLRLQGVLQTMTAQASALLNADASIIFLRPEDERELILAAQYNVHENLLGHRIKFNDGLAGKVATERRPAMLTDYRHQWKGIPDTPFAEQGFGSVIAVPLVFADEVVGVLLVVNGVEGRLFDPEDVYLLELLAPQAAVAITNSRLFEQQEALAEELETAKTQLEAFLLSTDSPVIALNRKMQVIFANQAATTLVAEDAANLRGTNLRELIPESYFPNNPRQLLRDLRASKAHIYELEIGDRTYMCHLARITQPEKGWVAVLNDVTSLKELDRLQRQMIELTTHQLKNPLQGAMLHLDELEDLGSDILTDDMRFDLSVVWEQMDRMQRLIQGILSLERLQTRPSSRNEQIDLVQILHAACRDLRDFAAAKQITLNLILSDPLPVVIGSTEELTEAMSNLIDNAIKYTPEKGEIFISAYAKGGEICLQVKDTGVGIPEEAQPRVFDRFFRAEQPGTEQIGGTGMGLSLVKAIIEAHHGRVWLESTLDSGTTFFVSLPGVMETETT